jgi:putative ABC transport system substrate-binding protein
MHFLAVGYPDQFDRAFKEAIRARAGVLIVLPSVFYAHHLRHIAALARPNGLPAIFWAQQFAEVGGFMAYGPSPSHLWQRAATYIDKLIKGGEPADLPVEQSTTFELVINLTTTKPSASPFPQRSSSRRPR